MPKYFYPLVENPYRSKDINRAIKVLKSNKLTSGPISKSFQDFFTRKLRSNNSLMVLGLIPPSSSAITSIFLYAASFF